MSSLDTVHTLVDHLTQLDTGQLSAPADTRHDRSGPRPPIRHGTSARRGMRLLPLPLLTDHRRQHTMPIAPHALDGSLGPPHSWHRSRQRRRWNPVLDPFHLAVRRRQAQQPAPGPRPPAWAVCYDDRLTDTRVWRVAALDADGRVYQLSQTAREAHPGGAGRPVNPTRPATYPGLVQLAAASGYPPT